MHIVNVCASVHASFGCGSTSTTDIFPYSFGQIHTLGHTIPIEGKFLFEKKVIGILFLITLRDGSVLFIDLIYVA